MLPVISSARPGSLAYPFVPRRYPLTSGDLALYFKGLIAGCGVSYLGNLEIQRTIPAFALMGSSSSFPAESGGLMLQTNCETCAKLQKAYSAAMRMFVDAIHRESVAIASGDRSNASETKALVSQCRILCNEHQLALELHQEKHKRETRD